MAGKPDSSRTLEINVAGLGYRELNRQLEEAHGRGIRHFILHNVCGQRYIGSRLQGEARIDIHGTPGNDLAAFLEGPAIEVFGNAQDAVANTMDNGRVVIHGNADDVAGFSMRGGQLFIKGSVGYRAAIHMKASLDQSPLMVVGGSARDFLAEYMAGGTLVVMGLDLPAGESVTGRFTGTGMHGGAMFIRGEVEPYRLGREVGSQPLAPEEHQRLAKIIAEYGSLFGVDVSAVSAGDFTKYAAVSHRPYGNMYAY